MNIAKLSKALFLSCVVCLLSMTSVWARDNDLARPVPSGSTQSPSLVLRTPNAGVDLALSVQGAPNLGGFEVELVYNRALATIDSVTLTDLLGKTTACDPATARCAASLGPLHRTDRTRVGGYSVGFGAGPSTGGALAILHLTSTDSIDALSLTLANALVVDTFGDPVGGATLSLATVERKSYLPIIAR